MLVYKKRTVSEKIVQLPKHLSTIIGAENAKLVAERHIFAEEIHNIAVKVYIPSSLSNYFHYLRNICFC